MSDLANQFIDETYGGILHTASQAISSSDIKRVYDGYGNETPISISKDVVKLGTVSYALSAASDGSALIYENGYATFKSLVNSVYPVGSVYFSVASTDPSTIFGGSWSRISEGRFIAGVGTGNDGATSKNLEVGNGDGEYVHTLTESELPAHKHTGVTGTSAPNDTILSENAPTLLDGVSSLYHENSGHTGAGLGSNKTLTLDGQVFLNNTGEGVAHNNIPPTFALYIWQRNS